MKVFVSKIDQWLLMVILACVVLCAIAAAKLLGTELTLHNSLFASIILFLGVVFPLWLLGSTRYYINQNKNQLIITSGPFKWRIDIESITSIKETRNPISSPALSLDRLIITYGKHQQIMISPKLKHEFLVALAKD
ncbi:hypothetical protein SOPP22_00315 [Shewanella sp. OPT22]|nr:hypothetical protein SOPP22_00315 [Shewanella sp. OPT22]